MRCDRKIIVKNDVQKIKGFLLEYYLRNYVACYEECQNHFPVKDHEYIWKLWGKVWRYLGKTEPKGKPVLEDHKIKSIWGIALGEENCRSNPI